MNFTVNKTDEATSLLQSPKSSQLQIVPRKRQAEEMLQDQVLRKAIINQKIEQIEKILKAGQAYINSYATTVTYEKGAKASQSNQLFQQPKGEIKFIPLSLKSEESSDSEIHLKRDLKYINQNVKKPENQQKNKALETSENQKQVLNQFSDTVVPQNNRESQAEKNQEGNFTKKIQNIFKKFQKETQTEKKVKIEMANLIETKTQNYPALTNQQPEQNNKTQSNCDQLQKVKDLNQSQLNDQQEFLKSELEAKEQFFNKVMRELKKQKRMAFSCPKLQNLKQAAKVAQSKRKVQTNQKKCKFFPFCTKSNCKYYHPQEDCKYFPNCKSGLSCKYKHKQCRYGFGCNNLKCVYTHPPITYLEKQMVAPIKRKWKSGIGAGKSQKKAKSTVSQAKDNSK